MNRRLRSATPRAVRTATAVVVLLLVVGCAADMASGRLHRVASIVPGRPVPVTPADFPNADFTAGNNPSDVNTSSIGSRVLCDALIADAGIRSFVKERGIPDAIAVADGGFRIELYYLRPGTVYALEHSRAELVSPRSLTPSALVASRALIDAERDGIDPEARLQRGMEQLRAYLDGYDHVLRVGRRIRRVLPPEAAPAYDAGFVLQAVTPASQRLFNLPDDCRGLIVGELAADTPAANVLKRGDVITQVGDKPVATMEDYRPEPGPTLRLTIRRGNEAHEVVVERERLPRALGIVFVDSEIENAFAGPGWVVVTSAMLKFVDDDDQLAALLGHEMAHVIDGHAEKKVTPGSVLKGVFTLGVVVPAEIAVPAAGQLLNGLTQGIENRFNRDQERVADREGIAYAARAGFDPNGAIRLLEKLAQQRPVGAVALFFDAHPSYPERIEEARQAVAAVESTH